jgi:hypothetical protein
MNSLNINDKIKKEDLEKYGLKFSCTFADCQVYVNKSYGYLLTELQEGYRVDFKYKKGLTNR